MRVGAEPYLRVLIVLFTCQFIVIVLFKQINYSHYYYYCIGLEIKKLCYDHGRR